VAGIGLIQLVGSLLPQGGDGNMMFVNPDVGVGQALRTLAILMAAGVLAGLAPAQRALQISPMEALRSE